MNRRKALKALAGLGIGTAVFHRAVVAMAQDSDGVTSDMIAQAEWVAGLELSPEERESVAQSVNRMQQQVESLREVDVAYSVVPAMTFKTLAAAPDGPVRHERSPALSESSSPLRPASSDDLAFLPVTELAELVRTRQVSSTELTKIYLERLRKFDPLLKCVVSFTEERALAQAKMADEEIRAGRYRGPLHGIPWGAKDLVAYPGYPTTWGAPQFEQQQLDYRATVAQRLDDAGAVLVAKLSLGALAMGDRWFRGMTRNPWNPEQGSSGSSAGPASASVAGLVGFSIGSETLGSIVSPCRRCGATGLRPTFGRVSRYGCMPLSWSMDKIGPISRSVEDCALVFAAIQGADGLDPTVDDHPFYWPPRRDVRTLRVGYTESRRGNDERPELDTLRELGVELVPIELPNRLPTRAITSVLNVEAATVFDGLTRRGDTEGLNAWPGIFRQAEFMTAVEYLRAMRVRRMLMEEMEEVMAGVDAYVNGNDLTITNLTGHPCVVMPIGYRERDGRNVPQSVTFTGRLFGESDLLALAHAYQKSIDAHLQRPPLDEFLQAGG